MSVVWQHVSITYKFNTIEVGGVHEWGVVWQLVTKHRNRTPMELVEHMNEMLCDKV